MEQYDYLGILEHIRFVNQLKTLPSWTNEITKTFINSKPYPMTYAQICLLAKWQIVKPVAPDKYLDSILINDFCIYYSEKGNHIGLENQTYRIEIRVNSTDKEAMQVFLREPDLSFTIVTCSNCYEDLPRDYTKQVNGKINCLRCRYEISYENAKNNGKDYLFQRDLATPQWADREAIKKIYEECRYISMQTGILHHVDHVIPLRSGIVSGLHIAENLQIIPATDNLKKSNRFGDDNKRSTRKKIEQPKPVKAQKPIVLRKAVKNLTP